MENMQKKEALSPNLDISKDAEEDTSLLTVEKKITLIKEYYLLFIVIILIIVGGIMICIFRDVPPNYLSGMNMRKSRDTRQARVINQTQMKAVLINDIDAVYSGVTIRLYCSPGGNEKDWETLNRLVKRVLFASSTKLGNFHLEVKARGGDFTWDLTDDYVEYSFEVNQRYFDETFRIFYESLYTTSLDERVVREEFNCYKSSTQDALNRCPILSFNTLIRYLAEPGSVFSKTSRLHLPSSKLTDKELFDRIKAQHSLCYTQAYTEVSIVSNQTISDLESLVTYLNNKRTASSRKRVLQAKAQEAKKQIIKYSSAVKNHIYYLNTEISDSKIRIVFVLPAEDSPYKSLDFIIFLLNTHENANLRETLYLEASVKDIETTIVHSTSTQTLIAVDFIGEKYLTSNMGVIFEIFFAHIEMIKRKSNLEETYRVLNQMTYEKFKYEMKRNSMTESRVFLDNLDSSPEYLFSGNYVYERFVAANVANFLNEIKLENSIIVVYQRFLPDPTSKVFNSETELFQFVEDSFKASTKSDTNTCPFSQLADLIEGLVDEKFGVSHILQSEGVSLRIQIQKYPIHVKQKGNMSNHASQKLIQCRKWLYKRPVLQWPIDQTKGSACDDKAPDYAECTRREIACEKKSPPKITINSDNVVFWLKPLRYHSIPKLILNWEFTYSSEFLNQEKYMLTDLLLSLVSTKMDHTNEKLLIPVHEFDMQLADNRLQVYFDGYLVLVRMLLIKFLDCFQISPSDERYFQLAKHKVEMNRIKTSADDQECNRIALHIINDNSYSPNFNSGEKLQNITLREMIEYSTQFRAESFKSLAIGNIYVGSGLSFATEHLSKFKDMVKKYRNEPPKSPVYAQKSIVYRLKTRFNRIKKFKTLNLYEFGGFDHKKNTQITWLIRFLNYEASKHDFKDFSATIINATRIGPSSALAISFEGHSHVLNPNQMDQLIEVFLKKAVLKLFASDSLDKQLLDFRQEILDMIRGLTFSLEREAEFYLDYLKEGHEEIYRPDHILSIAAETTIEDLKALARLHFMKVGTKISIQVYPSDINSEIPESSLPAEETLNGKVPEIRILK